MSEFTEHLRDVFAKLGPITVRAMFGGHGIYHQDVMFALVVHDTLFLKTDPGNIGHFQERGLEAFEYMGKDGRTVRMSYHRAPEEMLENPNVAVTWARRSFDAANRAHKKTLPANPRNSQLPPPARSKEW